MSTIIGSGNHRYRVDLHWAKLPACLEFRTTHGVVEDLEGNIYILHTGDPAIFVFKPDGSFIRTIANGLSGGHGITHSVEEGKEYLYLAFNEDGYIAKITLDGDEIFRIGTPDLPDIYPDGKGYAPTQVAVSKNGDIYVADGYGKFWIHQYSREQKYLRSFGGQGESDQQLNNPHGIMVDTRSGEELLLISDRRHTLLKYFTLDGKFVRKAADGILRPCTTIQAGDKLYIPELWSRITVLDRNDTLVTVLGEIQEGWLRSSWPNIPIEEWQEGAFSSPHDLHVSANGDMYVVEWLPNGLGKVSKLQKIEEDKTVLKRFLSKILKQ